MWIRSAILKTEDGQYLSGRRQKEVRNLVMYKWTVRRIYIFGARKTDTALQKNVFLYGTKKKGKGELYEKWRKWRLFLWIFHKNTKKWGICVDTNVFL